jgi:hypothetical protein
MFLNHFSFYPVNPRATLCEKVAWWRHDRDDEDFTGNITAQPIFWSQLRFLIPGYKTKSARMLESRQYSPWVAMQMQLPLYLERKKSHNTQESTL